MPLENVQPPFLKPGDEVAIVSPSFTPEEDSIEKAVKILENWRLKVHVGRNTFRRYGPFAGDEKERLMDIQEAADNKRIKAVLCSRGGYGMLKIVDRIDFSGLKRNPKWFAGFSDITVLHMWLSRKLKMISIHGEMPVNFSNNEKSEDTINSLYRALFGDFREIKWKGDRIREQNVTGRITGGNLSLLYSLVGTAGDPVTKGKILFIEEVGEYLYHLDRMMVSLKLSGKLEGLAALIVGGLSRMEESKTPWGVSPESIITDIVSEYDYPVFFGFPAGHIPDNRAFYLGKKGKIIVAGEDAVLTYA